MAAALLAAGIPAGLRAADGNEAKEATSAREELRQKLKNMTPEERRAALKKWREEHPQIASRQEENRKARAELKNRTPEQREARRKEMRAAMEKRIAELKKKQADGTITDQEKQRLARLERALNNADRSREHPKPSGDKPSGDKPQVERPPSDK